MLHKYHKCYTHVTNVTNVTSDTALDSPEPKISCALCVTRSKGNTRPPLSSDIIIFTDRPELKAKGERIIFEDREVLKQKFSLGETALFNPDRILVKLSRILTEN